MQSSILELELTNFCNANCLMCPRNMVKGPFGKMNFDTFKRIMEEAGGYPFKKISFSGRGEPLLNPEAVHFIEYARSRNKGIEISLTTNLSLLSPVLIEALEKSGLSRFSVSFSGYDQNSYEKIMRNLRFDNAVDNLKKLISALRKNPHLSMVVIPTISKIFPLEEYAKTRSFLKGLGVNDTELPGYYVCNNRAGGLAEGELVDQQFYASLGKTILPAEDIICLMPFRYQTILWNGDFDLCCADFEGKTVLGNVLTHSFSEIDAAKEKLLENRPLAPICTTCTTPFALGQGKGFLQRKK